MMHAEASSEVVQKGRALVNTTTCAPSKAAVSEEEKVEERAT